MHAIRCSCTWRLNISLDRLPDPVPRANRKGDDLLRKGPGSVRTARSPEGRVPCVSKQSEAPLFGVKCVGMGAIWSI